MTNPINEVGQEEAELIELLADYEHERWSRWHEYAVKNWTPENVKRWNGLAKMRYEDLTEYSKESDREEVRKYWPLISSFLSAQRRQMVEAGEELAEELKAFACTDKGCSDHPFSVALDRWNRFKESQ